MKNYSLFFLRILFLSFMCFVAYQNLKNLDQSSKFFSEKYNKVEKTLQQRFNFNLPSIISSKSIETNKNTIIMLSSTFVFLLSLLALFKCPGYSTGIGINYFIFASIVGNFYSLEIKKYMEMK